MTSPAFDLNQHTARLLLDEPFFAALSRRMDKRAVTSITTAGVRLNPDTCRYELVYNPKWFTDCIARREAMGDKGATRYRWVKGTLVHEFMHIVLEHVTGRLPSDGMSRDWNIAGDLAINGDLMETSGDHHLPPECCFPGEGPFADFPVGLSAEAYHKLIDAKRDEQDEQDEGEDDSGEGSGDPTDGDDGESGQGGQGGEDDSDEGSDGSGEGEGEGEGTDGSSQASGEPHGDHTGWGGEGSDDQTAREIANERMREDIKQAAEEADKTGTWGSVSARTRAEIRESLRTTVDWRAVLRYFVRTTVKADKRSTVRRVNKRYPYIHSGKRVNRYARIAISIDQSGSVSSAMLEAFYGELSKLAKLVEFTVIPFDDEVFEDGVHVWKKGQSFDKKRYCCGGTNFDAPTNYVNEHKFDAHIVLTDMYAPKPVSSRCPRIWMTDRNGASHPYFQTNERVIAIEDKS